MPPNLNGRRVLLVGAETELGGAIAQALAEAGATVALVATRNDAETAFAVKRLARRIGAAVSQAIDGANDMAVRVMIRQVGKQVGGLDAIVHAGSDGDSTLSLIRRYGGKELAKSGGVFLTADAPTPDEVLAALADALASR